MNITFRNDVLPMKDKLYRLAFSITLNKEDAEDTVQEAMIKIWKRREQWNEIESLEAWALTITRRTALDLLKQKGRDTEDITEIKEASVNAKSIAAMPSPHEMMLQKERIEMVRRIMQQMPEKLRTAMQLRDFEEKSYKEVAEIMGIPEEQVKVCIFRARQFIKKNYCDK